MVLIRDHPSAWELIDEINFLVSNFRDPNVLKKFVSVECGPKSVKVEISDTDLTNNAQFASVASGFVLQGQRLGFLSNVIVSQITLPKPFCFNK